MLRHSLLARTVALASATLALGAVTGAASAQDATSIVTADVSALSGTRVLTTTTPTITMGDLGTGLGMDGTLSTVVTEVGATGVNPWSVTLSAAAFTSGTTADTIGAANLTATPGTTSTATGPTPSGDINISDGSAGTLDSALTLLQVTGQSTTSLYTTTYTQDTDLQLAIPNGIDSAVYTTTLSLTLVE